MRRKYFTALYRTLNIALGGKRVNEQNEYMITGREIDILEAIIGQFRDYLQSYQFENNREEYQFFKKTAPQFYSLHIYYIKMLEIEQTCLAMRKQEREIYLRETEHYLKHYLKQYEGMYHRMLANDIETRKYFRRNNTDHTAPLSEEFAFVMDHRVCTSGALFLSKMIAYQRVLGELGDR